MKSIKFKMWINMMTVVAVLITVIWLLFAIFLQNFYEFAKEGEVKKSQKQYITMLENSRDMGKTYDKIMETGRRSDTFVEIYNQDKEVVYSPFMYISDNAIFGKRVPFINGAPTYAMPSVIQSMEDNGQKSHTLKLASRKSDEISTIVLINRFENNNNTYYIALRASLVPVQDTRLIFNRFYMIILAVFLVMSLILSLIFAEFVSKPISRISHAAKEVSRGNYDVVVPSTGGKDEMSKLTEDFNNMTKELTKVDALRKDLLANVSHELKTPLTMIRGYAETIKDLTGDNPEKRVKQLDIIIDEADRLSNLIGNVLDLSRLQAGKREFVMSNFDMSELAKNLILRYDIFKDQGYEFDVNIAPDVRINGDFGGLEQVICNLIDNAINHSDMSQPIKITLNDKGEFSVINFGDVIEEENIRHIWDRYYKIDKSGKRRVTGTGIGLSIVKEILVAHGYEYGVTSTKESGTEFWVKFPLEKSKNS